MIRRRVGVGTAETCRAAESCPRGSPETLRDATTLSGRHGSFPEPARQLSGTRQPSVRATAMLRDHLSPAAWPRQSSVTGTAMFRDHQFRPPSRHPRTRRWPGPERKPAGTNCRKRSLADWQSPLSLGKPDWCGEPHLIRRRRFQAGGSLERHGYRHWFPSRGQRL